METKEMCETTLAFRASIQEPLLRCQDQSLKPWEPWAISVAQTLEVPHGHVAV